MTVIASQYVPVNILGEVVVQQGTGPDDAVAYLPQGYFPVDTVTNKVVMKLPDSGGGGTPQQVTVEISQDGHFSIETMQQITPRGVCNAVIEKNIEDRVSQMEADVGMMETTMVPIGEKFLVAYTNQYRHGELSVGLVIPTKTEVTSGARALVGVIGEGTAHHLKLTKISDAEAYLFYIDPSSSYTYLSKITIDGETVTVAWVEMLPNTCHSNSMHAMYLANRTFLVVMDDTDTGVNRALTFAVNEDSTISFKSLNMFGSNSGSINNMVTQPNTLKPLVVYDSPETNVFCVQIFHMNDTMDDVVMMDEQRIDYSRILLETDTVIGWTIQPVDTNKYIFAFSLDDPARRQLWWVVENTSEDYFNEWCRVDNILEASAGVGKFLASSTNSGYYFFLRDGGSLQYIVAKYELTITNEVKISAVNIFPETLSGRLTAEMFPSDPTGIFVAFRELAEDKYLRYKVLEYTVKLPANIIGMSKAEDLGGFTYIECGPVLEFNDTRLRPGSNYYIDEKGKVIPATVAPFIGTALTDTKLLFTPKHTV